MKYKVKQYLLRAAPLILVCCMFLFILSPSASAAPINYRDLDYTVVVDGDNDIVTVSLPVDSTKFIFCDANWNLIFEEYGSEFTAMCSGLDNTSYHFGFEFLSGSGLSLSNIPSSTELSFSLDITSESEQVEGGSLYVDMNFADNSGASVSSSRVSLGNKPLGSVSANFVIPSISSAVAIFPSVWWSPLKVYYVDQGDGWYSSAWIDIRVVSVTLTMSISSLYRLQEETGRSNDLLEEVKDQLAEQGKDIDQIINGEVEPEAPEGADKVDDLDNAEGQLRDEAQIGLDQGVEIQQNVLQILEQYANGFAVFSWIFGLFAKLPFFSGLLYVSVALGTVAALLNLGLTGQARARSNARKKGG